MEILLRPRLRYLVGTLLILCLVAVTSTRHIPTNPGGIWSFNSKGLDFNQTTYEANSKKRVEEESKQYREMKKVGSSPPSCEHKCYGCMPCEAIQVPTTTSHVGVQYANYEPEGWKCKCGPAFYSP